MERIRDIRASEKVFYRQVLEIYATSIDYDPKTNALGLKNLSNISWFITKDGNQTEIVLGKVVLIEDGLELTFDGYPDISMKFLGYAWQFPILLSDYMNGSLSANTIENLLPYFLGNYVPKDPDPRRVLKAFKAIDTLIVEMYTGMPVNSMDRKSVIPEDFRWYLFCLSYP